MALALVLFALDGFFGLGAAVAIGGLLTAGQPPRRLILIGAAFIVCLPVVVIARGLPSADTVSSSYILHDTLASNLAFVGLSFVVIGIVVDGYWRVRAGPAGVADPEATEQ
ncbi:MAG TPA: hypothetical protein VGP46_05890 [Acidimicrobiales bacterium]|nr:hypothetical protein [Acidimicrobiales bacterium]